MNCQRIWTAPAVCLLWLALLVFTSGCSATGYRPGTHSRYYTSAKLAEITAPQIEWGEPRPVLDAIGWVIGIPDKIVLWDRRMANHHISPETAAAIDQYLACNELTTVKVRLNQYAPLEDWRRLRANHAVGAGWRYTLGTLSWVGETILPGRIFGYDHFNPFTNTVHLFSDAPAIALHEAGHAKDFALRRYKGTYAAIYLLPGAPLWHEAKATEDALAYLEAYCDAQAEAEGYRLLYPAYGTYAGDAAGYLAPDRGLLVYASGVLTGHLVGRLKARRVLAGEDSTQQLERLPPVEAPPHEIAPTELQADLP